MSANSPRYVTNSLGLRMPAEVAAIIEDHRRHPERGRLIDRINAYYREQFEKLQASASPAVTSVVPATSRAVATITPRSSNTFSFHECTPGGTPIFEGSLRVSNEGRIKIISCRGYLLTIPQEDEFAVVVLDIGGTGMVPCLCPVSILDENTKRAYEVSSQAKGLLDRRKEMHCRTTELLAVNSAEAHSDDDVHGCLILDGPNNLRGRVVDTRMLASLNAGCLRTGAHALRSYYTLDRPFCVDTKQLANNARSLLDTTHGIQICPSTKRDIEILARLGNVAIESRLTYHDTITKAIIALDEAGKLPPPEIDDILLQVSVGGDRDALQMGKFLPCVKLRNDPDITVRCACGFNVDGMQKSRGLLKRQCNRKSNR